MRFNYKTANKILISIIMIIVILAGIYYIREYITTSDEVEVVDSNIEYVDNITVSGLSNQVSNKEYLEASVLGLLYTEANNEKLIEVMDSYNFEESSLREEELANLIDIHHKTFLNRYLKIYVIYPTEELNEVDKKVKNKLYEMKEAYETLSRYGGKKYKLEEDSEGNTIKGNELITNYNQADLKLGLEMIKEANQGISHIIKDLSLEDAAIEKEWLDTELTESELINVLDKTNSEILD